MINPTSEWIHWGHSRCTTAQNSAEKIAAQVKRYDTSNGRNGTTVVRSYNNIHKIVDGASISAIFATNEFTKDAHELAEETELRLIDGIGLANFIEGIGGHHIVNQYMP